MSLHQDATFLFAVTGLTGLPLAIIQNVAFALKTWSVSGQTESQFSEQNVFPLILPVILELPNIEISKYDKAMISMEDYKPDLLVMLRLKHGVQVDFFVCEIKKPGCSSNKYESDFLKLQSEMKSMINVQVGLGVDNPVCYGLLVEGYDCYLYCMALPHDAEYRSKLIRHFRLMRDASDTFLLLPAITTLGFLKDELVKLRTMLINVRRSKKGHSTKQPITDPLSTKPPVTNNSNVFGIKSAFFM